MGRFKSSLARCRSFLVVRYRSFQVVVGRFRSLLARGRSFLVRCRSFQVVPRFSKYLKFSSGNFNVSEAMSSFIKNLRHAVR